MKCSTALTVVNLVNKALNRHSPMDDLTLEVIDCGPLEANTLLETDLTSPRAFQIGSGFWFENQFFVRGRDLIVRVVPDYIIHQLPQKGIERGYHLREIKKRNYGTAGKIQEELDELNDAHEQGSKIMMLVELADLYGAIEGYLEQEFPDIKMHDLAKFSTITKRAFKSGHRS